MDGTFSCAQVCHNTNGSYVCGCMTGYQLDSDGLTCIDINECNSNNNGECEQNLVRRSLPHLMSNRMCNTEGKAMYNVCFIGINILFRY